jgi:hypothetical protein
VSCPFFTLRRHFLTTPLAVPDDERCHIFMGVSGSVRCFGKEEGSHTLALGDTVLLPASGLPAQLVPDLASTVLEVFWD